MISSSESSVSVLTSSSQFYNFRCFGHIQVSQVCFRRLSPHLQIRKKVTGTLPAFFIAVVILFYIELSPWYTYFVLLFFITAMESRCSCFFRVMSVFGTENQLSNNTYPAKMSVHCMEWISSAMPFVTLRCDWRCLLSARERSSQCPTPQSRFLSSVAENGL